MIPDDFEVASTTGLNALIKQIPGGAIRQRLLEVTKQGAGLKKSQYDVIYELVDGLADSLLDRQEHLPKASVQQITVNLDFNGGCECTLQIRRGTAYLALPENEYLPSFSNWVHDNLDELEVLIGYKLAFPKKGKI